MITTAGVVSNAPSVSASNCAGSGGTSVETYAAATGAGVWSCSSGALAGYNGTMTFLRVGTVVLWEFSGELTGPLACSWSFNQSYPQTLASWRQICAGTLANTSA